MATERRGPEIEIRRGSWEERLAAIVREAGPGRWAFVVEAGADALADLVRARLPEPPIEIRPASVPVKMSEALAEIERVPGVAGVCVAGQGDRQDARRASFRLGRLAALPWVFVHRAAPPSELVPTIGEKVVRYLAVIEGLAFTEGPRLH